MEIVLYGTNVVFARQKQKVYEKVVNGTTEYVLNFGTANPIASVTNVIDVKTTIASGTTSKFSTSDIIRIKQPIVDYDPDVDYYVDFDVELTRADGGSMNATMPHIVLYESTGRVIVCSQQMSNYGSFSDNEVKLNITDKTVMPNAIFLYLTNSGGAQFTSDVTVNIKRFAIYHYE